MWNGDAREGGPGRKSSRPAAFRFDDHDLEPGLVPGDPDQPKAGEELGVPFDQLDAARLGQGEDVHSAVGRPVAHAGLRACSYSSAGPPGRPWEMREPLAVELVEGPRGVVEMQVGEDARLDVGGLRPCRSSSDI